MDDYVTDVTYRAAREQYIQLIMRLYDKMPYYIWHRRWCKIQTGWYSILDDRKSFDGFHVPESIIQVMHRLQTDTFVQLQSAKPTTVMNTVTKNNSNHGYTEQ